MSIRAAWPLVLAFVLGAVTATVVLRSHADLSAPLSLVAPSTTPVASTPSAPASPPAASAAPTRLPMSAEGRILVEGARSTLGDVYDARYYAGGPPPRGRGACTDVLYYALRAAGVDLQKQVSADITRAPSLYPNHGDDNIDYRRAPNLIVWFARHAQPLPADRDWRPGDVVFWSLTNDGVADHCGIVSDQTSAAGTPLVIHNVGPACSEDDALRRWRIMGHFRGRR